MRYLISLLFTLATANASDNISMDNSQIILSLTSLLLWIIILYTYYIYKCNKGKTLLNKCKTELEELNQKHIDLEKDIVQKDSKIEKDIIELNHTIDNLKHQIHEGTKNQVVLKIEELERKRQNRQNKSLN